MNIKKVTIEEVLEAASKANETIQSNEPIKKSYIKRYITITNKYIAYQKVATEESLNLLRLKYIMSKN